MDITAVCVGYAVRHVSTDTAGVICSLKKQVLVLIASLDFTVLTLTDEQANEQLEVVGDTELEYAYAGSRRLEKNWEQGYFEQALDHACELAGLPSLQRLVERYDAQ